MHRSFLRHLVSKAWTAFIYIFFRVSNKHSPCFIATEEAGGDKRLELNLRAKLMGSLRQILINLAVAAIAEAILTRVSAEQVPALHRAARRYLKLVTSSTLGPLMLISALMMLSVTLVLTWLY